MTPEEKYVSALKDSITEYQTKVNQAFHQLQIEVVSATQTFQTESQELQQKISDIINLQTNK